MAPGGLDAISDPEGKSSKCNALYCRHQPCRLRAPFPVHPEMADPSGNCRIASEQPWLMKHLALDHAGMVWHKRAKPIAMEFAGPRLWRGDNSYWQCR
jgi:hypothetical protein